MGVGFIADFGLQLLGGENPTDAFNKSLLHGVVGLGVSAGITAIATAVVEVAALPLAVAGVTFIASILITSQINTMIDAIYDHYTG